MFENADILLQGYTIPDPVTPQSLERDLQAGLAFPALSSDLLEVAANCDQVVRPPRHSWTMRKDGKHTAERHRRAVQLWRARHYLRQIPQDWPPQLRAAAKLFVMRRCMTLGKKQLARVVWPWTPRPASPRTNPLVRVPRGRAQPAAR